MDSLEKVGELVKSCFLPALKQDLDTIPLEKEHFNSYHDCLRLQLPLLYDWIQQEPTHWLFSVENLDSHQQELQSTIIILLCELSSPKYLFQLDVLELINNCDRVLMQFPTLSHEVELIIFRYYQELLHKDMWKRQLGATHGFVKYLEFKFKQSPNAGKMMSLQFLMFSLSVGLNVRTHYDTHYKYLSTCIYSIMLKHGNTDDILSTNLHSVIYDSIFKDLHIMDSAPFIVKQWNCLLKCLDFFTEIDSFTWSQVDDSLEFLLRHIPLAPDSKTSMCLLKYVSELVIYFNLNRQELKEKLSEDLSESCCINEFRELGRSNTSYTCFRWAKAILQVFILESYRLMQSAQTCKDMLKEMHRCYILTILPIGLTVIEIQLITFFEKFTAILMEVSKVQNFRDDIMQVVTSIVETFCYQLESCDNSHNLSKFKDAYHNLLQVKLFKNYAIMK